MRKVACVLLVLVMLLGVLAFAACNEASNTNSPEPTPVDYFTFRPNDERNGYILVGTNDILPANVVIPAEYKGLPVTGIYGSAFTNNPEVITVYMPESIRYFSCDFGDCPNLTTIYRYRNTPFLPWYTETEEQWNEYLLRAEYIESITQYLD